MPTMRPPQNRIVDAIRVAAQRMQQPTDDGVVKAQLLGFLGKILENQLPTLSEQLLPMPAAMIAGRMTNPIRGYHGTPDKTLKVPDPSKAMEVPGTSWFSTNRNVAEQYQWPREYGEIMGGPRGRVIEANLHVTNPMTVDFKGAQGEAIRLGQLANQAKQAGHDALVVHNVDDSVDSSKLLGTSIAVFDKSVIEFVKKYGVVGAVGAGLISGAQARQLQAQGYE